MHIYHVFYGRSWSNIGSIMLYDPHSWTRNIIWELPGKITFIILFIILSIDQLITLTWVPSVMWKSKKSAHHYVNWFLATLTEAKSVLHFLSLNLSRFLARQSVQLVGQRLRNENEKFDFSIGLRLYFHLIIEPYKRRNSLLDHSWQTQSNPHTEQVRRRYCWSMKIENRTDWNLCVKNPDS